MVPILRCFIALCLVGAGWVLAGEPGTAAGNSDALALALIPKGYVGIPLTLTKGGMLDIEVKINGQALRFVVDSGACVTMIGASVAARLKLPLEKSPRTFGGAGGDFVPDKFSVKNLSIGEVIFDAEGYTFDMTAVNASRQRDGDPPCDGIVGANVFLPAKAVIDYAARRLFLLKTPAASPK